MKEKFMLITAALIALLSVSNQAWAENTTKLMAPLCTNCHMEEPGAMVGFLANIAVEASLIQMNFTSSQEIIKFNADTGLKNLESFRDINNYKNSGFKINFTEVNDEKIATEIIRFDLMSTLAPADKVAKDVVKKIITNPLVKIFDVRPPAEFKKGHLPGARPIPVTVFDKFVHNLPEDKETPIVFYGTGGCSSHVAFIKAKSLGYKHAEIYDGGYLDWNATEYVIVDVNWLKNAIEENIPHILIDLRPTEDVLNGHIKGAVAIPITDLDNNKAKFPTRKDAPIIFYGPNSKNAATQAISWGYTSVGILPTSFDGWQALSDLVEKGSAKTTISLVQKSKPATISANNFEKLAGLTDDTLLFIDVRNPEEFVKGSIYGATNIPLAKLSQKAQELPKDKNIILFSNKGGRAEMAHTILNLLNLKNRYLDAELSFDYTGFNILEN